MNDDLLETVLKVAADFAQNKDAILALGLCGSWAKGTATPHSDFDLCIVTTNKELFRQTDWLQTVAFEDLGAVIDHYKDVNYSLVWSRHVF